MSQRSREHVRRLYEAVGDARSVLVLTHNDPDPDAIASAVALRHLLEGLLGSTPKIAHLGIVGRAENRALVDYLGSPVQPLVTADWEWADAIALVDSQPGAGNNPLGGAATADVVIDHHSWREETASVRFYDVRPELGATSTILAEYLQAAGMEPDQQLATALFYGIKTDTRGLSRGATEADAAAYLALQPNVDSHALADIEQAQVPASYFRSFNAALRAARTYDGILVANIGRMDYPDLAAEVGRFLLRLENARWVICMGVYGETFFISVRHHGEEGGAEQLVKAMVGADGTAGGHGLMAGGQIYLAQRGADEIAGRLTGRALEYLGIPRQLVGEPLL
jgi:nanoRNase/pAp phosphatase (c-di-AMP/oligoRNAs hydrolase)